jgi:hypothetical protein
LIAQTANSEVGLQKVVGKSFDFGKNPNKPIMSTSSKAMLGPKKNFNKIIQPVSRQSKLFGINSDLQLN